jgi:hypothetical protein
MNCNNIVREHVQTVFGDGPWEPKASPLLPQLSDEECNSGRLYLHQEANIVWQEVLNRM